MLASGVSYVVAILSARRPRCQAPRLSSISDGEVDFWRQERMIGAVSERPRKVKDLSTGQRLAAAAYAAPHEGKIFGTIEVDASEALRFLKQKREEGVRLTMIHMVVRSAALALRDVVPELNRMIRRGQLYQRPTVDIFVSVGMNHRPDISRFNINL